MTERRLFEMAEEEAEVRSSSEPATGAGMSRWRVACRDQLVMRMLALDPMLPAGDEARTVVAFVEQVAVSELYRRIRAGEGGGAGSDRPQDSAVVVVVRDDRGSRQRAGTGSVVRAALVVSMDLRRRVGELSRWRTSA